jgi:hypothetical protein
MAVSSRHEGADVVEAVPRRPAAEGELLRRLGRLVEVSALAESAIAKRPTTRISS